MTRISRPFVGLLTAVLTSASALYAQEARVGDLMMRDARAFASVGAAKSGAAYVTIMNHGAADDVLIDARAEFARAQIHRTVTDDQGVTRMLHQHHGVAIPAGKSVEMAPGGLHVMLMGLSAPLAEGDTIDVTLTFRDAGEVRLPVAVVSRKGAADGAGHGADHGGGHGHDHKAKHDHGDKHKHKHGD